MAALYEVLSWVLDASYSEVQMWSLVLSAEVMDIAPFRFFYNSAKDTFVMILIWPFLILDWVLVHYILPAVEYIKESFGLGPYMRFKHSFRNAKDSILMRSAAAVAAKDEAAATAALHVPPIPSTTNTTASPRALLFPPTLDPAALVSYVLSRFFKADNLLTHTLLPVTDKTLQLAVDMSIGAGEHVLAVYLGKD